MEQVFIILAVVLFWIFKGVAGGQRRLPGQDPYRGDTSSHGGPRDIGSATRQKTLEAQQVALDALQRWEEKQRLSSGYGGPAQPADQGTVPAASRTRVGRPAGPDPAGRSRFEVRTPASAPPAEEEVRTARPVADRRPSDAAIKRDAARKDEAAHKAAAARKSAVEQEAEASGAGDKANTRSVLASLERLPLAARAIVYAEILGPPRSLS